MQKPHDLWGARISCIHTKPDIYIMNVSFLAAENVFREALSGVSAYRKEKVLAMKFPAGRCLSLGVGLLMEEGLSAYGLHEKDMHYRLGENEKPYFSDFPSLYFNVSHSGEMAMAAFSVKEIGCDIEKVGKDMMKIAKHCFHPEEIRALEAILDPEEQNSAFFRLWTLKESYIKGSGLGLAKAFSDFCILDDAGRFICKDRQKPDRTCAFGSIPLPGYWAAWCEPVDTSFGS